jgi:transcriptional regulator with PAS, ATPase and Fis domain
VQNTLFREDLFYRLNVIRILLPPLRERKVDIVDLSHEFIDEFGKLLEKKISYVSDEYIDLLHQYDWPGNIRELKNAIHYSITRMTGEELLPAHINGFFRQPSADTRGSTVQPKIVRLREVEQKAIYEALRSYDGNKVLAAKALGIGRATLYRKLSRFGLLENNVSKRDSH